MAQRAYVPKEIALEELETALHLWFEGREYFSILALAGAADGILSGYIRTARKRSQAEPKAVPRTALEEMAEACAELYRILQKESPEDFPGEPDPRSFHDLASWARNLAKHLSEGPGPVTVDARAEAFDLLVLAIRNYERVTGKLTPAMDRFRCERSPS